MPPVARAAARGRVTVREIRDPADPALRPAYRLLSTVFPRGERVLLREWTGSLRERAAALPTDLAWHLLVAERDGVVIGLASGTYLGNVNVGVIGYLATAPGLRAAGLGTRLRRRLLQSFARDATRVRGEALWGVLGEVSETNPWLRRLSQRPEVLLLDFPYFQPRLYEDDEPSPFVLYLESPGRVRTRLPVTRLRQLLFAVWRRVYRIARPLDRPAFRAMMRALNGRRSVGRRRLTAPPRHDH